MKNQLSITAILKTAFILFLLLGFSSCKEEDPPPPGVDSFTPTSGPKGTEVTIKGISFGSDGTKIKVYFNDVEAVNVTLVSDTEIKAKVPERAYTGIVKVVVGVTEIEVGEFTYEISERIVSTLAGSDFGNQDGQGANAKFAAPYGAATDAAGNVYIADNKNHAVRKITPDGTVTTLATNFDLFNRPWGIVVDQKSGDVYVGSRNTGIISKITSTGEVSKFAGLVPGYQDGLAIGPGDGSTDAMFNKPLGLAIDAEGNIIVADANNHAIRKIDKNGNVTTIAGVGGEAGYVDGKGAEARFNYPSEVDIDADGNILVCDNNNHRIRKISPSGDVTTLAGSDQGYADGKGAAAQFDGPWGLAIGTGGLIYVWDNGNKRVRQITPDGDVTTIAGTGDIGSDNGPAGSATFSAFNGGIAVGPDGSYDIFIPEAGSSLIRKIVQF